MCVAVCCSVLQCLLQCVTVRSPVLHARAKLKTSWCIFECVAVCVAACVAMHCRALQRAFHCVLKVSWCKFNQNLLASLAGSRLVYLFFFPLFFAFKRDTNYRALCTKWPIKIRHPMGLRQPVVDLQKRLLPSRTHKRMCTHSYTRMHAHTHTSIYLFT